MTGRPHGKETTRPHLVLPGPRRSDRKRRRLRYLFAVLFVLIAALGWIGYQELFSATTGFSGP